MTKKIIFIFRLCITAVKGLINIQDGTEPLAWSHRRSGQTLSNLTYIAWFAAALYTYFFLFFFFLAGAAEEIVQNLPS